MPEITMGSNSIVDLSHHDSVESFHEAYDAGIRLCILKASQGTSFVDPRFFERVKNLSKYLPEMRIGAYHFGTGAPAIAQSKFFIDTVRRAEAKAGTKIKLLCLDYETNPSGSTMSQSQAEDFVRRHVVETAKKPLLYGGHLLRNVADNNPHSPLLDCELWLADYRDEPRLPEGWRKWRIWQYSAPEDRSGPPVPGIGVCDKDKFNGSPEDLKRWFTAL